VKKQLNIDEQYRMYDKLSKRVIVTIQSRAEKVMRDLGLPTSDPNMHNASYVDRMKWLAHKSASPAAVSDPREGERRIRLIYELAREFKVAGKDFNQYTADALIEQMIQRLPKRERDQINDLRAHWMFARSIGLAKIFVIETDLMKAVLEASIPDCDHQPMFPYAEVWAEPEGDVENPLDEGENLLGLSMSYPGMSGTAKDTALKDLEAQRAHLPFKLREEAPKTGWSQFHTVVSRKKTGGKSLAHWEYYGTLDCAGYNVDGVKNGQESHVPGLRKPTSLTVRMLSYLVSSNVEYVIVNRADASQKKRKRTRHDHRAYYVTRVRKRYVHGIRDREPTGRRVRRHDVIGHIYHRWYCGQCKKAHAIRRFIAEPPESCVRCGAALCKLEAVIRAFWQKPHPRGADVAEQAARRFYKVDPPEKDDENENENEDPRV